MDVDAWQGRTHSGLMLWMKEWIRLAQLKVLAVVLKERAH